ncbi:cytochrome b [Phenylobacterium sp.]|uniref:cytochrome b n=1 Tax=Phenylobacterium sp. TaxID=1871053 RepID=UPI0035AE897D
MSFVNTRTAYGWAAIALHWISAAGVVALYLLGERMEEASGRAEKIAAMNLHVSVGVLLFTFLVARMLWSASQPHPGSLEHNRAFRTLARAVQGLFLLMIAVLLITGPLAVWSTGRPLEVFGAFAIPTPFATRVEWLHELTETVHGAATKLFWPLIVLHVAGALKHLVFDRDATLQRMLWVRRPHLTAE